MDIDRYRELIAQYIDLVLSLHLGAIIALGGIVTLYVLVALGLAVLVRTRRVPAKSVRFVKWLFLIFLIEWAEYLVVDKLDTKLLDTPLVIFKTFIYWLLVKSFLEGVYAEIYIKRIKRRPVNQLVIDLIKFGALIFLLVGAAKSIFDIQPSSILTSSAILTAVIGLSMQDTIGSIFSGLLIQMEKPFDAGDWIAVGDLEGQVVETSWRYTRIRTVSDDIILIPNNAISKERVVNYSRPIRQKRCEARVRTSFDVPPVKVRTALSEAVKASSLVSPSPAASIRIVGVSDFLVEYRVYFFTSDYDNLWAATDQLYASIWYQFRKHGITVPRPQRDVHMFEEKPGPPPGEDLAGLLAEISLFEGLAPHDLETLVAASAFAAYAGGERIVARGEREAAFYVLVRGRVEVKSGGVVLAELEPGSFFGEMGLLTDSPRSADVVALEPCQCLKVDREGFKMLLETNPAVRANVTDRLKERRADSREFDVATRTDQEPDSLLAKFKRIFAVPDE